MENKSKLLSEGLKAARGTLSQAEFAKKLKLQQGTYQRYEDGRMPKGDVLHQMATQIGVTVEELLTGKRLAADEGGEMRLRDDGTGGYGAEVVLPLLKPERLKEIAGDLIEEIATAEPEQRQRLDRLLREIMAEFEKRKA